MAKRETSPVHDAHKLRAQAERGRLAEELINNPLLIEALDAIDQTIEEGWKNSSSEDRQARDNAYLLHRLLTQLRSRLKSIVVSGANARSLLQLEEIKGGEGT